MRGALMHINPFTEGVVVTHVSSKGTRAAGQALDESLAGSVGEVPDLPPLSFRESIPAFMRRAFRPVRALGQSLAARDVDAEEVPDGYPVGERLALCEHEWRVQESVLRACGRTEDEINEHHVTWATCWWRADVTR